MDVQRTMKSILSSRSPSESLVKQATSLSVSTVSLTRAYQIATFTTDPKECCKIFNYILKRMNDHEKYIQHISNALQLSKMLLAFGSNQFLELMQSRRSCVESLKKYNTYNSDNAWIANKIKELANEICQILDSAECRKKLQVELKTQYDHDTHLSAFPSIDDKAVYDLKSEIYPRSREEEEAQLRQAIELSRENERMKSSFGEHGRDLYVNCESPDCSVSDDPFSLPPGYNQQIIPASYSGTDIREVCNRSASMNDGYQRIHDSQEKNLNFPGAFMEVNPFATSSAQAPFDMGSQGYYPTAPYPSVDLMGQDFSGQSSNFHSSQSSQPINSSFSSIPGLNTTTDYMNSSAFYGAPQAPFNTMESQQQQKKNPFGPSSVFVDQSGPQNFERNNFSQASQTFDFPNRNESFGQSSGMCSSNVNDLFRNSSDPFSSPSAFPSSAFSTTGPSGMVDFKDSTHQQPNYTQQQHGGFPTSNFPFTVPCQPMQRPPNNNNNAHQFGGNKYEQSQPFGSSQQPNQNNNNNNYW